MEGLVPAVLATASYTSVEFFVVVLRRFLGGFNKLGSVPCFFHLGVVIEGRLLTMGCVTLPRGDRGASFKEKVP